MTEKWNSICRICGHSSVQVSHSGECPFCGSKSEFLFEFSSLVPEDAKKFDNGAGAGSNFIATPEPEEDAKENDFTPAPGSNSVANPEPVEPKSKPGRKKKV